MTSTFSFFGQQNRCSYRPGEAERQTQPGVLLDGEWIGAQNWCGDVAKYTVSRRHHCLEVLQAHREISPAASRAAVASILQQTLSILKLLQLYLEYTWSQNLRRDKQWAQLFILAS